jgi:uncharacterized protein (DUF1778 family)
MAMTLRLTPEQDHALTLLASAHGTSKHEAVVRAIALAATRTIQDTTVDELAREHIKGHRELEADIRRSRGQALR